MAVVIILCLIAAVLVWLANLDVNDYRPRIERQIEMRTGVPVSLGNMSLDLWPRVSIKASDIALGGQAAEWMTVKQLSITMPWSALLRGRLSFNELRLTGLSVELIRDQQGGWNIDPLLDQLSQSDDVAVESSADLRITSLIVVDSQVSLTDESAGQGILASQWQLEARRFGDPPWELTTDARLSARGSDIEASIDLSLHTDWPDEFATSIDRLDLTLAHSSSQPAIQFELPSPARLESDWTVNIPKWQLRREQSRISGSMRLAALTDFDSLTLIDFESDMELRLEGSVMPQSTLIAPQAELKGRVSVSNDQGMLRLVTDQLSLDQSSIRAELLLSLVDSSGEMSLHVDRLDLRSLLRLDDTGALSTNRQGSDTISLQWLDPIEAHIHVDELIHVDGRVSNLDLRLNSPGS